MRLKVGSAVECVCKEPSGRKWYFDRDRQAYLRLDRSSLTCDAFVYGRFLPDEKNARKKPLENTTKRLIAHWKEEQHV